MISVFKMTKNLLINKHHIGYVHVYALGSAMCAC